VILNSRRKRGALFALGLSACGNLLVVVYTYRNADLIRLISAWKASKDQRKRYEEGRS
jgi:uncharacterized DUF497 family protein